MYPITFLTSCCFLLMFCNFGATEPPPARGYGPPSPVEFGSNEIGSHEQYNAAPAIDLSNFHFESGPRPGSYKANPSGSYTKSSPSFSPHYSNGGGSPIYKSGPGGKGGSSSSYISIVHGGGASGGPAGPSKLRAVPYAAGNKGPAPVISSYNSPSFGGPATFGDGKGFGSSNAAYVSGEIGGFGSGSGGNYKGFAAPAAYSSGSYDGGYSADYNKGGYESGGASDEVASYTNGGPSYATYAGTKNSFGSPSFSHGSRGGGGGGGGVGGNAYSTSNVNIGSGGGGGGGGSGGAKLSSHGNFNVPSYSGSFKPSGAKVYSRYSSGGNSYGTGSPSNYPSFSNSDNGYNSRALKTAHNADEEFSGEETNVFGGAFGDGAGFKVQSSYSTG